MSHITHTNESRHKYDRVTSRICVSQVACTNASRQTYERVMSHIVSHIPVGRAVEEEETNNRSHHTYECVTSHVQMSHITLTNG